MTKSDKIREYFRKHPDADVAKVAAKFEASKPMTYKMRGQVQAEWQPPAMVPVPMPSAEHEAGAMAAALMRASRRTEQQSKARVAKYFAGFAEETDIDGTLNERAQDYGKFKDGAALMQGIKRLISEHARLHDKTFADDQWEALEMIVHKIARIVNGNPDKVDSWVDIAGYATLVADRLQGNAR
jgi:hypothetical protein